VVTTYQVSHRLSFTTVGVPGRGARRSLPGSASLRMTLANHALDGTGGKSVTSATLSFSANSQPASPPSGSVLAHRKTRKGIVVVEKLYNKRLRDQHNG